MTSFQEDMQRLREEAIISIRSTGSTKNKERLEAFLELEAKHWQGKQLPYMIFGRLSNEWMREHTKKYQTPTILRN